MGGAIHNEHVPVWNYLWSPSQFFQKSSNRPAGAHHLRMCLISTISSRLTTGTALDL